MIHTKGVSRGCGHSKLLLNVHMAILTDQGRCVYGLHHNLEQIIGSKSKSVSYDS